MDEQYTIQMVRSIAILVQAARKMATPLWRTSFQMVQGFQRLSTGNNDVSIYKGSPDSSGYCPLLDTMVNKPEADPSISSQLPAQSIVMKVEELRCPPTVADFNGDGTKEVFKAHVLVHGL